MIWLLIIPTTLTTVVSFLALEAIKRQKDATELLAHSAKLVEDYSKRFKASEESFELLMNTLRLKAPHLVYEIEMFSKLR